jgi:uncharacterized membrane protein YcjF (UPF0283 family)
MKKSLFWQLFLPIAGVFVVCLAVIAWYVPVLVEANAEKEALAAAEKTVLQFKTITPGKLSPRCSGAMA